LRENGACSKEEEKLMPKGLFSIQIVKNNNKKKK